MIQKKICMVGAFGVGKTSLVARFVYTKFSEKYQTTVGVKIDKKVVQHPAGDINLILWDLAGEDALTTVRPAHLKGASGYILVMDGLRRNTLEVAIDLHGRVSEAVGAVPFVCVVNKADLRETWEIQQSDLDNLVSRGWTVVETSAKTGAAVEGVFQTLTDAMMQEHHVDDSTAGAVAG
ncbi:MAG: GTP-binding protein [Acidobacteriia bacterium]|nr:GTP-binding protein [Terriglobia bacterium]